MEKVIKLSHLQIIYVTHKKKLGQVPYNFGHLGANTHITLSKSHKMCDFIIWETYMYYGDLMGFFQSYPDHS